MERSSILLNNLSFCLPEQALATNGSKGASKDPADAYRAMPPQGVLTRGQILTVRAATLPRISRMNRIKPSIRALSRPFAA